METGGFNSDVHYIYYRGRESLWRNEIALIVNKSPKCSTWVQSQKFQKRQNHLEDLFKQTAELHLSSSKVGVWACALLNSSQAMLTQLVADHTWRPTSLNHSLQLLEAMELLVADFFFFNCLSCISFSCPLFWYFLPLKSPGRGIPWWSMLPCRVPGFYPW